MGLLGKEFARYQERVMVNPPEIQVVECRRAFFAGATALYSLLAELQEPQFDEKTALARFAGLGDEMEAFAEMVGRGLV